MKRRTTQYHEFEWNGETLELELPINLHDWENPEIKTIPTFGYIVLGYLAHDSSAPNPLEDWDAMGTIHHHPRSRYGSRDDEYYSVLGLDSYGDPVIDEDKVQMMWRDMVLAIPEEHFELEGFDAYALQLQLADEAAGDYDPWSMCCYAWRRYGTEMSDGDLELLYSRLEDHLTWDWAAVCEACWVNPDPDAVLLDRYEHGLCSYSVHGDGGCRWDTSRGEAVWVPDKYLLEELKKFTDPDARRAQAVKYAEQACDVYTDWCNGRCYGHVVAVYDFNGDLVEEDSCWGYIGDDAGEEALREAMDYYAKKYMVPLPDPKSPQLELEL